MQIDLHGYRPVELRNGLLARIVQQCWEMGEAYLRVIHGHGRMRGISPGFYNTNTGALGLAVRDAFRHDKELRQWIYYTTLDCRRWGETTMRLKPNRAPSRSRLDGGLIEDRRAMR
jgi:hypothetical protein